MSTSISDDGHGRSLRRRRRRTATVLSAGLAVVASIMLFAASPAHAVLLLPDTAIDTGLGESDPFAGAAVLDSATEAFVGGTFSGTVTSTVLSGDTSNPFGGLTFTYLIANDEQSTDSVNRLSLNGFGGFGTDVSYQTPATDIIPSIVERSEGVGDVISWSFIATPTGQGIIGAGASSALLVIQTGALDYTSGLGSVIDGTVASVDIFVPVPEPGAAAAIALAGAGLLLRRHRQTR